MFKLTEKRFADFFRGQAETGMGYTVVTAHLKDGRVFPQVVVAGGYVTNTRGFLSIPFTEADIDQAIDKLRKAAAEELKTA